MNHFENKTPIFDQLVAALNVLPYSNGVKRMFLELNGTNSDNIINNYLLPILTPEDIDSRFHAGLQLKRTYRALICHGGISDVLNFALYLKIADETGIALQKFYELLEKEDTEEELKKSGKLIIYGKAVLPIFGKTIRQWCEEYFEYSRELFLAENGEEFPEEFSWKKLEQYLVFSSIPFVCEKMLGINEEQPIEEVEQAIEDKLRADHRRTSKEIMVGWLLNVYILKGYNIYKAHNPNDCKYLLKKAFTVFNNILPEGALQKESIFSYILKLYVDWSVKFSGRYFDDPTQANKGSGLGMAIAEFASDKNNKPLIDKLRTYKSSEWNELLYFSIRQTVSEGAYEIAADLLLKYFAEARRFKKREMRQALLDTFSNLKDEAVALALFSLLTQEQQREQLNPEYPLFFTDEVKSAISARFGEIVQSFISKSQKKIQIIKASVNENTTQQSKDEIIRTLQEESERYNLVTDLFPSTAFFEKRLMQSMKNFLTSNGLENENLLDRLDEKVRQKVVRYLRQADMIYSLFVMLEADRSEEEMYRGLDYSPAILQLTKALEYVANCIYRVIDLSLLSKNTKLVTDNGHYLGNQFTLGKFQYFFSRTTYPELIKNSTRRNKKSLKDLIDVSKYCTKQEGDAEDIIFNDIKKLCNLRNNAAHKNSNGPAEYKVCEGCLLTDYQNKQYFLWNLLYMLNKDEKLPDFNP